MARPTRRGSRNPVRLPLRHEELDVPALRASPHLETYPVFKRSRQHRRSTLHQVRVAEVNQLRVTPSAGLRLSSKRAWLTGKWRRRESNPRNIPHGFSQVRLRSVAELRFRLEQPLPVPVHDVSQFGMLDGDLVEPFQATVNLLWVSSTRRWRVLVRSDSNRTVPLLLVHAFLRTDDDPRHPLPGQPRHLHGSSSPLRGSSTVTD